MPTFRIVLAAAVLPVLAFAPPTIADGDTRAWWATTAALSTDAMAGRDTGSPGYDRAADYVTAQFKAAGLQPAGNNGSYRQNVPLHEVRVDPAGTHFSVAHADGSETPLRFLHQISVRANAALPAVIEAPLSFRGYCSRSEMGTDLRGKIAVCFGGRRSAVPGAAERAAAAAAAGAVGLIAVDDPGFTIEPTRWPDAYARTVTFRGDPAPADKVIVMRLAAAALESVIAGSGHDAAELLAGGAASRALPLFDIPARLRASFRTTLRDIASDNVLGILPGTDPKLHREVIVVSAHLDGYGSGEAVDSDTMYNGAFDDAAYVATLIRLAERRHGKGFRRSVLFAAFTGEEKGLLGATWFTRHPTRPRKHLAADINLDQLRPLFPLRILTVHALADTTLGATVAAVAAAMHIETRADREPERNLLQRADHWPFLKIGVPATGFIFGYDAGTEAERRYREWYAVRYHRPQDDMTQPIDFQAAADFNMFFYRLTATVADAAARPVFINGSKLQDSATAR
ncbi:M28 family peptidase [Sphingosinicellaceae bacterium]|nr:M28 family peptidase [Sphingosinicellaceae bacterium]